MKNINNERYTVKGVIKTDHQTTFGMHASV